MAEDDRTGNELRLVSVHLSEAQKVAEQVLARSHGTWPVATRKEVVKQLIWADSSAKHTHGLVRVEWLASILPDVEPEPVRYHRTPAGIAADCHGSVGYVSAREAISVALQDAPSKPFSIELTNSFPTGMLSYYALPLLEAGFDVVGFATNPRRSGSPGTNPVCIGVGDADTRMLFDGSLRSRTIGTELLERAEGMQSAPVERGDSPKIDGFLKAIEGLARSLIGPVGADRALVFAVWPRVFLPEDRSLSDRPGARAARARQEVLSSGQLPVPAVTWQKLLSKI